MTSSSAVSQIPTSAEITPAVDQLRQTYSAMRLSFAWLGTRKSLSSEQRTQAALQFGADEKSISAGKKLIDSGHPAMRTVNQLKRQMIDYWKGNSLPFPEPGIRLVRRGDLDDLNTRMADYQRELDLAVRNLESSFEEIKSHARARLGELYCESDYPGSMHGQFEVCWDFPNVEPPNYLQRLNPELYYQEWNRMRNRFQEAVQLAEQAFMEELSQMVSHLAERLSGSEDGRPKVFRDSAVEKLTEFFDRFQRLSITSHDELESLVERARRIVAGVRPEALRADEGLRQQVATQLSGVQSVLDGLMVDRPRRRLIRGGDA